MITHQVCRWALGPVAVSLAALAAGCSASSAPANGTPSSAATSASTVEPGIGRYTSAQLPASVWIKPGQIPMNSSQDWQPPYWKAVSAGGLVGFEVSALRHEHLNEADQGAADAFPAAISAVFPGAVGGGGEDNWEAQEEIVAAPDHSNGSLQKLSAVFQDVVAQTGACQSEVPGAQVVAGVDSGSEYSATITFPLPYRTARILHEFIAMPYGYVVEFSVWAAPDAGDQAPVTWSGVPDSTVLADLEAGPCAVSKQCSPPSG